MFNHPEIFEKINGVRFSRFMARLIKKILHKTLYRLLFYYTIIFESTGVD